MPRTRKSESESDSENEKPRVHVWQKLAPLLPTPHLEKNQPAPPAPLQLAQLAQLARPLRMADRRSRRSQRGDAADEPPRALSCETCCFRLLPLSTSTYRKLRAVAGDMHVRADSASPSPGSIHVVGTESTLPPICGCVLVVAGTGERALLRFNTHTHTHYE